MLYLHIFNCCVCVFILIGGIYVVRNYIKKGGEKMQVEIKIMQEGAICDSCGEELHGQYGIEIPEMGSAEEGTYCKRCGKDVMDNYDGNVVINMHGKKPLEALNSFNTSIPKLKISSVTDDKVALKLLKKYMEEGINVNAIAEFNGVYRICKLNIAGLENGVENLASLTIISDDGETASFINSDDIENKYYD